MKEGVKLNNLEKLFECIKKIAKRNPEKILLPNTFFIFGSVKYDESKCIACLTCYENCPLGAYDVERKFDLSMIKKIDLSKTYWKRAIIYQLIMEIAVKDLEGYVEVPEGLPGYGSVKHNEDLCISCRKCVDLCPTGALSFECEFDMKKIWR